MIINRKNHHKNESDLYPKIAVKTNAPPRIKTFPFNMSNYVNYTLNFKHLTIGKVTLEFGL